MHSYGNVMYYESKAPLFYIQLIVLKAPKGVLHGLHDLLHFVERKTCDESSARSNYSEFLLPFTLASSIHISCIPP